LDLLQATICKVEQLDSVLPLVNMRVAINREMMALQSVVMLVFPRKAHNLLPSVTSQVQLCSNSNRLQLVTWRVTLGKVFLLTRLVFVLPLALMQVNKTSAAYLSRLV